MMIGTTTFPAGSYSVWTLPKKDGTVDLIVNSQHGQYETDCDASHDIAHVADATGELRHSGHGERAVHGLGHVRVDRPDRREVAKRRVDELVRTRETGARPAP
jgi:hypothetical protein